MPQGRFATGDEVLRTARQDTGATAAPAAPEAAARATAQHS